MSIKGSAELNKLAELGVDVDHMSVLELDLDLVLTVASLGQNLGHNLGSSSLGRQRNCCEKSSSGVCYVSVVRVIWTTLEEQFSTENSLEEIKSYRTGADLFSGVFHPSQLPIIRLLTQ